ncbi:MAG: tyrosine-protein phosphatase [Acholeplasmatales bacterium]|nr:tyrosine-protein phosphatase [Acholeplasmatales bacterium]
MQCLDFDGLRNARDLSQFENIKEKRLIRSEELNKLSKEDIKKMQDDYNVKVVIDLRTEKERKHRDKIIPNAKYYNLPISNYKALKNVSDKKLRKHKNGLFPNLCEYYRRLVSLEKKNFWTELFKIFLDNGEDGAILWHCVQGKDRTGVVAAVMSCCLGVDENKVMDDYLFTNVNTKIPMKYRLLSFIFMFIGMRKEFLELFTARKEYLESSIEYIKNTFGGFDGFLHDVCGIDDTKKEKLKSYFLSNYLEA